MFQNLRRRTRTYRPSHQFMLTPKGSACLLLGDVPWLRWLEQHLFCEDEILAAVFGQLVRCGHFYGLFGADFHTVSAEDTSSQIQDVALRIFPVIRFRRGHYADALRGADCRAEHASHAPDLSRRMLGQYVAASPSRRHIP